jgi:hypothetical protein
VEVQGLAVAAQLGQGWEVVDPRQDREHVQQVGDAVGGQIRSQRPRGTGRHPPGRVGVVHRLGETQRQGLELGVVAVVVELGHLRPQSAPG